MIQASVGRVSRAIIGAQSAPLYNFYKKAGPWLTLPLVFLGVLELISP